MKVDKTIKRHHIPLHTPEWHAFRKNGIGASEVASVMAMESALLAEIVHTPPIKLFLSKVGEPVQEFTGNQASEAGRYQEERIINLFKYYDFENPDGHATYKKANDKSVKPLNKIISPKAYFTNTKYPHLFSSPDGIFYKDGKPFAVVEAKLTNSFEANKYPNRVSPAFVLQVYQNMMILGLKVGYLCILIDGLFFEVITLTANDEIFQRIELATAKFWAAVLQARIYKEEHNLDSYYNINPAFLSEHQRIGVQLIQELEPSLSGTESELEFIREICKPTAEYTEMIGTDIQFQLCIDYLQADEEIKAINTKKDLANALLIKELGGFHAAKFIVDGEEIKYTYKPNKNGKASINVSNKFLKSKAVTI